MRYAILYILGFTMLPYLTFAQTSKTKTDTCRNYVDTLYSTRWQSPDTIIINKVPLPLKNTPLEHMPGFSYFKSLKSHSYSSMNIRGYIATWEIRDKKLYLIHLSSPYRDPGKDSFIIQFKNKYPKLNTKGGLFADWVCYSMVAREGRNLKSYYKSTVAFYEKEMILEFEKGELLNVDTVDHTQNIALILCHNDSLRNTFVKSKLKHSGYDTNLVNELKLVYILSRDTSEEELEGWVFFQPFLKDTLVSNRINHNLKLTYFKNDSVPEFVNPFLRANTTNKLTIRACNKYTSCFYRQEKRVYIFWYDSDAL